MKAQRQDSVTSFSRFKIMINPTLMLGQKEYGGLFEYYIKKKLSVEFGGGVNLKYSYPWETSKEGIKYGAGEGFTIRTGLRYYLKSGFYFNPVFFYRNMTYYDRYYESYRNYKNLIYEPGTVNINFLSSNGDKRFGERLDENKQVFAFEALFGKEVRSGRMIIDYYAGIGIRNKYNHDFIAYSYSYSHGNLNVLFSGPFVSPQLENAHGYLPSIQLGFQIGLLPKSKKYLAESK